MKPLEYWRQFEELVARVLVTQGYSIIESSEAGRNFGGHTREIDIVASDNAGKVRPIEVKLTRRRAVTLSALRDASSVTASLKDYAPGTMPMLVLGSRIDPDLRQWAEKEFGIEIWDRDILSGKAGSVAEALEHFFREFEDEPVTIVGEGAGQAKSQRSEQVDAFVDPRPALKGQMLIDRLGAVQSGKKQAKEYENICQDIIAYLFGNDLRDMRSQRRTLDGINIYDMVYRVRPQHPFWITLTRDFRTRVVLFECKNYGKPIGPVQVFTTERYLSSNALRSICFVLTRKPAHKHAVQAAFGAMRDSGKLLVFLSDADIIQMLLAKDVQLKEGGTTEEMAANDPTEVLDQKIYEFVSVMPR